MDPLKILVKSMETKEKLRNEARLKRNSFPMEELADKSKLISDRIDIYLKEHNIKNIFMYSPINGEVNVNYLRDKYLNSNIGLYYPKVRGAAMTYYKISSGMDLRKGAYNIPEPVEGLEESVPQKEDVVLVPGLAFNKKGYRIGYGKGYYDTYFYGKTGISLIGVCYDFQLEKEWNPDIYDVKMNIIITEKRSLISDDRG